MHYPQHRSVALAWILVAGLLLPGITEGFVKKLYCEGLEEPMGVGRADPQLGWKLDGSTPGQRQTAYHILAASAPELLEEGRADLWDSGNVESDQSTWVSYRGQPLVSRQEVFWKVRAWDQDGDPGTWSKVARFEVGLLQNSDWSARWMRLPREIQQPTVEILKAQYGVAGHPEQQVDLTEKITSLVAEGKTGFKAGNDLAGRDPAFGVKKTLELEYVLNGESRKLIVNEDQRVNLVKAPEYTPQYLRRVFQYDKDVARARLYVTAKGLYEVFLNGQRVGNDQFAPGWTSYENRIETLAYDVTGLVHEGENVLGALLGEGWYAGRLMTKKFMYPEARPALLLQLEITRADGSTETIVTDDQWVATEDGPVRTSAIYDGEVYDANLELPGWNNTGFDDQAWLPVATEAVADKPLLVPKRHAPVRVTGELPTVSVTEPEPGRFIFDLGQNMVGWPRISIPVEKGKKVTVRFAEMLEKDGRLYTANYRNAKSTDEYVPAASGSIAWEPTFTFHGFRYVELSGLPQGAQPEKEWVTGVVLHSDMRRIGDFTSSHAKLNKLQSNIVWGQRGNFLDIPTDCPQRDERLGWTGDAQVFAPAALFNYDSHAFFKSWLTTMRDDQAANGSIPHVIPKTSMGGASPGWQDAGVIVPWEVYLRTGDREVLEENFDMMQKLVGFYRGIAKENRIVKIGAFGDWLQPYAEKTQGDTPYELIGTAYYALDAEIVAKAAGVLGRSDEAKRFADEAASVKKAFADHYFTADGKLQNAPETQTAYLMAIGFGLIPEELKKPAGEHLVRLVHEADDHLRTGFLGTPLINPVLDRMGYSDLSCTILFKETYPSWFFSINQGATTMWERWNSYSHADGFGNPGMNSFNHYAYGAVGTWMVERLAGLAPDPEKPGYRHFFVRPLVSAPLDAAAAELDTPYGMAASRWTRKGDAVDLEVVVPPNASATIVFPDGRDPETVPAGTHRFTLQ